MPLTERDSQDRSDWLGRSPSGGSSHWHDELDSKRPGAGKPGTSPIPGNDNGDGSELIHRRHGNYIEDEIPVSSMPEMRSPVATSDNMGRSGSNNGPSTTATEIPPVQVMERIGESGNPAPYRLPSSVFMRTKSTAPMEWSTASNESLFSIHMGNTSFNKDMSWMGRSGELGKSGEPVMPVAPFSTEFTNFSVSNTPTMRGADAWNVTVNLDSRPVDSRPLAPGLQMEPYSNKDSIPSLGGSSNLYRSQSSRHSDASGASVKSFAFPILTGDDRGNSRKSARLDSSTKPQTHFKKTQHEPPTPRTTETPNKPAQNTQQGGWFSWLSCCCRNCS